MAPSRKRALLDQENSVADCKSICLALSVQPAPPRLAPVRATFASISDKELLFIFSRVALADLFSLKRVNHRCRWFAVVACSDRTSLVIRQQIEQDVYMEVTQHWFFTGFTTPHRFKKDSLLVKRPIDSDGVEWLRARFPKLTQLSIYFVDHLSIDRFVQLIQLYPKLESLTIFSSKAQQANYHCEAFWKVLLPLESLHHLRLPMNYDRMYPPRPIPDAWNSIQIMERVGTLYYFGDFEEELEGRLLHSPNCNLVSSMVYLFPLPAPFNVKCYFGMTSERHEHTGEPIFVKRHMGLYAGTEYTYEDVDSWMKQVVIPYFAHSLTHFDLGLPGTTNLCPLLPSLVQLTHLTHIRLMADCDYDDCAKRSVWLFFPPLTTQNYRTKLANFTMPSITTLHIAYLYIGTTCGMFLYLSTIFPGVRVLHLEHPKMKDSTRKRVSSKLLARAIQRFPELTQVYINHRLWIQLDRSKDDDKEELNRVADKFDAIK